MIGPDGVDYGEGRTKATERCKGLALLHPTTKIWIDWDLGENYGVPVGDAFVYSRPMTQAEKDAEAGKAGDDDSDADLVRKAGQALDGNDVAYLSKKAHRVIEIVRSHDAKPDSKICIGDFTISKEFTEGAIWIKRQSGEGGSFSLRAFEAHIEEFYQKHF